MDGSIAGATPPAMPATQQQQQTVESKQPSPPSTNILQVGGGGGGGASSPAHLVTLRVGEQPSPLHYTRKGGVYVNNIPKGSAVHLQISRPKAEVITKNKNT